MFLKWWPGQAGNIRLVLPNGGIAPPSLSNIEFNEEGIMGIINYKEDIDKVLPALEKHK